MLLTIRLTNKLRTIVRNFSEVVDIILFGSTVRGKEKPNDVDILVLFKNKVMKEVELAIKKTLEVECKKVSIISKTEKTILDPAFDARESILFEGISLLDNKSYSSKWGFSSIGMFRYDFKDWSKLKKTKFYYAFNGRGASTGIALRFGCIKLSENIVLVPLGNVELFRDFLHSWGLEYRYVPLLVPERLNRKDLLMKV